MVFLPDIIDSLNGILRNRLSQYPDACYEGNTKPVVKRTEKSLIVYPAAIRLTENAKTVDFSLGAGPFTVYHRILSTTFRVDTSGGYGDGDIAYRLPSTDIRMIIIGYRDQINTEPENLAAIIADSLPPVANTELIKGITISEQSIAYDAQTVFAQEFKGIPFFIGPEMFMLSITYRVECRYMKGCFNNCNC